VRRLALLIPILLVLGVTPAQAQTRDTRTLLEVSLIALQAYDVAFTLRATQSGLVREANPIASGLLQHPAAWSTVKLASTTATIGLSRALWSRGHRWESLAVLGGSVAAMTYVTLHNRQQWCTVSRC
jgi:hypothetical protein